VIFSSRLSAETTPLKHAREHTVAYEDATVRFEVDLPPHAVAAVTPELAGR
jgi:hypothetical protein